MADFYGLDSPTLTDKQRTVAADVSAAFDRNWEAQQRKQHEYEMGMMNQNINNWALQRAASTVDQLNRITIADAQQRAKEEEAERNFQRQLALANARGSGSMPSFADLPEAIRKDPSRWQQFQSLLGMGAQLYPWLFGRGGMDSFAQNGIVGLARNWLGGVGDNEFIRPGMIGGYDPNMNYSPDFASEGWTPPQLNLGDYVPPIPDINIDYGDFGP